MGKMIAATYFNPKISYCLKNSGFKIYSAEELCYYINKYPELSEDFLYDEGLAEFISDKLKMPERGRMILNLINTNAPVKDIVKAVLDSCNYLTREETETVLKKLSDIYKNESRYGIKKKADCYFDIKDYKNAIVNYRSLIEDKEAYKIPEKELGDIWHNLGIACLKAEGFSDAADAFLHAYENNGRVQSLTSYLFALKFTGDEEGYLAAIKKYNVPEDVENRILSKIKNTDTDFSYSAEVYEISGLKGLLKEKRTDEFWDKVKTIVSGFKEEYRKNNG